MKVIIGLGNPGKKYEETRHNTGFLALDYIHTRYGFSAWEEKKKLLCLISEGHIDGQKILLAKPTVFMNESGQAVRKLVDFYKIDLSSIVVIHDDLDIKEGTLKETSSSRAAGHNGVADIIDHLGTQDFKRLRIGIGRPTEVLGACQPSHDYVLGKFTPEEQATLNELLATSFENPTLLFS
jgi:peptidyl-tRNA hydrolase, PTH1 family